MWFGKLEPVADPVVGNGQSLSSFLVSDFDFTGKNRHSATNASNLALSHKSIVDSELQALDRALFGSSTVSPPASPKHQLPKTTRRAGSTKKGLRKGVGVNGKVLFTPRPTAGDNASTERVFQCHETGCGKEFARKYNLQMHYRKHTRETPYQCSVVDEETGRRCKREFSWRSSLRHHNITDGNLCNFLENRLLRRGVAARREALESKNTPAARKRTKRVLPSKKTGLVKTAVKQAAPAAGRKMKSPERKKAAAGVASAKASKQSQGNGVIEQDGIICGVQGQPYPDLLAASSQAITPADWMLDPSTTESLLPLTEPTLGKEIAQSPNHSSAVNWEIGSSLSPTFDFNFDFQ